MFFCDPFGHTDCEHLYNFGRDDVRENKYIFMHDQEPIQLDAHRTLFQEVIRRNSDMYWHWQASPPGTVIVSKRGDCVKELESIYGWKSAYYFFHGWACLDWYRGYNRTYVLPHPSSRPEPKITFMSPNRIIGGQRAHRVLFLYHVTKKNLKHNHVSAPRTCPVETQDILNIAKQYESRYPDIVQVLNSSGLPWLFQNEPTQQMSSCWLSNFGEAINSLIYVPTETVYFGNRTHITEKTFKAIALGMPFIPVAPAGSLEYMRSYGFRTFSDIWNEDYDNERDDMRRLEKVTDLLAQIDSLSVQEKMQIQRNVLPSVEHNWNHFYHGGLEHVLWKELQNTFNEL